MPEPLRLLILEDSANDAELAVTTLEDAGYACTWERVDDKVGFLTHLKNADYDLILADYKMPGFDGLTALHLLRERTPDLPFIFVSGAMGEEFAIESLKAGATDYVLKSHLNRLVPVVERALKERQERYQRYRIEVELLRSEERFRQVIVSISDHIYVTELTADGRYINRYLSPHIEELTGYPLENFMVDRDFWPSTVIHPDDRTSAATQSDQLARGLNSETEYRIIRKDGQVLWVRDSARVQTEGTSKITYGLVSDITARKQAEEALRESEERYRSLFEDLPVGLYRTTPEGQVLNANVALVEMLGYSDRESFLETNAADNYVTPKERRQWQTLAEREGVVRDFEMQFRRRDGKIIWVRNSSRAVRDDEGQMLYYEGSLEDITERKLAADRIRKLNEELRQRVADRTRELSALYDVTAVAGESLDLETTLERSLERVLAAMPSKMGVIYLLEETDNKMLGEERLHMAVQQGLPADIAIQKESAPLGKGLTSWTIKHNEALIVPDVTADFRAGPMPGIAPQTAYVGVPIRARGQVLGAIGVFIGPETQLKVNHMSLLTSIADHVGVVVESARLRQQVEQAAVLEERGRLARELHDSVTQLLYSINLFAKAGRDAYRLGYIEQGDRHLSRLEDTAGQAVKEMRLLLYELRPPELEQEGLLGAIQLRLDAVEGRAGVKTQLLVNTAADIPKAIEGELYYLIQEALNNTLKHAQATSVTIEVGSDRDQISVKITDNGAGFDPDSMLNKGGMGLVNMRERTEKLGGKLAILAEPQKGTAIQVCLNNPGVFQGSGVRGINP